MEDSVINKVLRCYSSRSNFIVVPDLISDKNEIDHFIEVQYFTLAFLDLLNARGESDLDILFGYFFDLAIFVSGHKNLFKISKQLNQIKKNIPLDEYSTNSEILRYWYSQTNEGTTVGADVISLVRDMIERRTTYSFYTQKIGEFFYVNLIEPMMMANPHISLSFPDFKSINLELAENIFFRSTESISKRETTSDVQSLDDTLKAVESVAPIVSVVALPPSKDINQAIFKDLEDLKLLTQFIYLTGINYITVHQPTVLNVDLSIPDQVFNFRKQVANAAFLAITRGSSGILTLEESSGIDYSKESKAAEFRTGFIKDLFKDFNFEKPTLNQLTDVLNKTLEELKTVNIESTKTHDSLNMIILFHYFEDKMGLPGVKIPRTRLFYLQIEENSWKKAMICSGDSISFKMFYQDFKYSKNRKQMDELRPTLNAYVDKLSGASVDYIKKLSHYVVNTNK